MKNTEYYYLSNKKWGENYYELIVRHLDKRKKDADREDDYLTWLQYQFHCFIKEVFPNYYDGMFRVKGYKMFYKKTLEKLLR